MEDWMGLLMRRLAVIKDFFSRASTQRTFERIEPDTACPVSNVLFEVPPAVNDSSDFHRIPNHHIKNGVVPNLDSIVGVLAFPGRIIPSK